MTDWKWKLIIQNSKSNHFFGSPLSSVDLKQLINFNDRLEIMSPGGLANSLFVDTIDSNSIARNETLVNLLSRYYPLAAPLPLS